MSTQAEKNREYRRMDRFRKSLHSKNRQNDPERGVKPIRQTVSVNEDRNMDDWDKLLESLES